MFIPFWWSILFSGIAPNYLPGVLEINILLFLVQIITTFIVSFVLYYFGVWAAGDAKYLLVLSLFIPYIGIIPFIGNIALLTIIYLFGYFVWFWFGKCLLTKGYFKSLLQNIKTDIQNKWKLAKKNKRENNLKIITKLLLAFILVFVSIRLARIYLFNTFLQNGGGSEFIINIFTQYHFYIVFGFIIFFVGALYLGKRAYHFIVLFLHERFKTESPKIEKYFLYLLLVGLGAFISKELWSNYEAMSTLLIKILTLYLGLYLFIKILIYSYKITFGIGESYFKNIKDLKIGDMVDRNYLITAFGEQSSLGYGGKKPSKQEQQEKKDRLLYPDPKVFFQNLYGGISRSESTTLKQVYKITNSYHIKHKTPGYVQMTHIKLLNTFSFGPYIFSGFIVCVTFGNKVITSILNVVITFVKG